MAGAWFVGRGSNKMKLRGRWEVMKDTVKNSLVKIFFFYCKCNGSCSSFKQGTNRYFIFFKNKITLIAMWRVDCWGLRVSVERSLRRLLW